MNLKELLHLPVMREKIAEIFFGTFVMALLTIVIFMNWANITAFLTPEPGPEPVVDPTQIATKGYHQGVLGVYRISEQREKEYTLLIRQIPTRGYLLGLKANQELSQKQSPPPSDVGSVFEASIFVTYDLSRGQHLTSLRPNEAQALQKSILSTYYLGEQRIKIDDVLALDTRLLAQVNNALSVDVFQFLNQALDRANQLQGYLNLLTTLQEEVEERMIDLSATIVFLESNLKAQELRVELTEEQFFTDLEAFNGQEAQQELNQFIDLQTDQARLRAKYGAYRQLLEYYDFFLPRLNTMILAINANWDALIAGVRVTDIENMRLPLIIQP